MRVLITGTNGYIGKSLRKALREKYYVVGLNRSIVDLTDAVAVRDFFNTTHFFDVVIHCAVEGGNRLVEDSWDVMDKNLMMYYNLLANQTRFGKLIHFGSGAETYMPSKPYGYSKKIIAKSILNQDNFYNIKLFGVFDENELDTRFIKANIKRYIAKEPMQVYRNRLMDFFYMQDLIKVVEYYIDTKEPLKEFDCVYDTYFTLTNIAETLINSLGNYKVDVKLQEVGADMYISRYREPLPISFVGLEEGIKNVYNKLKNETN